MHTRQIESLETRTLLSVALYDENGELIPPGADT